MLVTETTRGVESCFSPFFFFFDFLCDNLGTNFLNSRNSERWIFLLSLVTVGQSRDKNITRHAKRYLIQILV